MGMQCIVCGKKPVKGYKYARRGKAKYLGGVGRKVTGITRRTFRPNLQRIHVWLPNGTTRYVRVATSVIRTGRISCSTTWHPACAACQAASEPARPAPIMWMVLLERVVMGRRVSAFALRRQAKNDNARTRRALSVLSQRAESIQPL